MSIYSRAFSQDDVKLTCNMNVIKTYRNGDKEVFNVRPIYEIYDTGRYLSIIPDTDRLASVSTRTGDGRVIDNFSDKNKWALYNKTENNGRIMEVKIMIDRNTGRIVYSSNWNKDTIITEGEGSCEKVDVSQKKF